MKGTIETKISANELISVCENVHKHGDRMQMAYAWHPDRDKNQEVLYFATMGSKKPFHLWRCRLDTDKKLPTLTDLSPLLGWYEREISDLYGISFLSHPEPYPLVLHEGIKSPVAPMAPDYKSETPISFTREPWQLPKMDKTGLQLLPFGPVRAGVCESAQFLYLYAGESILQFYEKLFFKHRGMEKRFEGLSPELGVILAERVSGVGSVAHALAFSQAIEAACECDVPQRAKQWRVILCELERLYNHLHYLGHLCHTTTLKVGEAQGKILEENLKQLNAKVTGSRFLREIITPGGLRREPEINHLKSDLSTLRNEIMQYCRYVSETNTHIDRLLGTGVLSQKVAFDEGATGPVCRASGIRYDFRTDHPYAAYDDFYFNVPIAETGDAYARMAIRIIEIKESFHIIKQALNSLSPGPIQFECQPISHAEGLGWAESPRGGLFYAVHFDENGKLSRVKIKSPSFSNWRVFPFTVDETNMMDYAINEASFGSTIAGCDR